MVECGEIYTHIAVLGLSNNLCVNAFCDSSVKVISALLEHFDMSDMSTQE